MVQLDHIFILTDVGGDEAAACLVAAGLTEGAPNVHPGQGTACRRFFFGNAYIELLWVADLDEARSEPAAATRLWERWSLRRTVSGAGACPFGVALRPGGEGSQAPFRFWEYRPAYLPEGASIQMAESASKLEEPMLFFLPFVRQVNGRYGGHAPVAHALGVRELTRVVIKGPWGSDASACLASAVRSGAFQYGHDPEYSMEVGFDQDAKGRRADLRPTLPLLFYW